MTSIGNFFYRNRKGLFLFLYLPVLLPSPRLFGPEYFGGWYYLSPIVIGLVLIAFGQVVRRLTDVGHHDMRRGVRIHALELETKGIFNHCRNPLYVSNLTVIAGLGILSNSVFYVTIILPYAFFLYFAIVWAEEVFLREKFGKKFENYCERIPRWKFEQEGLYETLRDAHLDCRGWFAKEYRTMLVWLLGLTSLILYKYPEILPAVERLWMLALLVTILTYGYVRHLTRAARLRKSVA